MISKLVENILRECMSPRSSDRALIIEVLQRRGANLTPHQIEVIKDLNFESIRRIRQKLQEQGKYLPAEEIQRERRVRSYITQQNIPQAKPERIPELFDQPKAVSWLNEGERL